MVRMPSVSLSVRIVRFPGQIPRFLVFILPLAAMLTVAGCGTYRNIPSHGGGKRFDEEQRVISSAIRQSIAEMDLSELRGKQVLLVVESIASDGGGNANWPGLQSINAGASINQSDYVYISPSRNIDQTESTGATISTQYALKPTFFSYIQSTREDTGYLRGVLEMKLRHEGIKLAAPTQAEAILIVLIDILGTNRSRHDNGLKIKDELLGSCELSYYAVHGSTGEIIFPERGTAASSTYIEQQMLGTPRLEIQRITAILSPSVPKVHEHPPTDTGQSNTKEIADQETNSDTQPLPAETAD